MTPRLPSRPRRHSRKSIRARRAFLLRALAIGVGVGALAALVHWFTTDRGWVTTDNAFVTGNIIPVQADATGVVAQVLAEETQLVKKGEILVQPRRAARARRARTGRSGTRTRRAQCRRALRQSTPDLPEITARDAVRERTRHDLSRYKQAAASGAASRQLLQNTEDTLASQEADLREARAEYQAIEARIGGLTPTNHPDIDVARARFNDAFIEYLRQNIRAPATGYVAKRRVQVGQRVRPGDPIINIVPLDHLWVEANLWENRMDRMRPGQPAVIKVDLYGSSVTYHGVVEGLVPGSGSVFATLAPDNATGNFIRIVQRVPVRISIDPDELKQDAAASRPLHRHIDQCRRADTKAANESVVKTSTGEYPPTSTTRISPRRRRAPTRSSRIMSSSLRATRTPAFSQPRRWRRLTTPRRRCRFMRDGGLRTFP